MKSIFVAFSLMVILVSCGSKEKPFVHEHDTVNVYYIDPRTGGRGWSKGVYDTKRTFVAKDSGSTDGKWVNEKGWQVAIIDSIRDPKTGKARYDSVKKTWLSTSYYLIDRHYIQPDSLPYKN